MNALIDPEPSAIELTEHAVVRYRERVRPALDLAAARAELAWLLPRGEVRRDPPDWTRSGSTKPLRLVIAETLLLPLDAHHGRWMTTTCVVRSPATPRRREQSSRGSALRATAMRARRRAVR